MHIHSIYVYIYIYIFTENHHVYIMGKLTISMAMFNSKLLVITRLGKSHSKLHGKPSFSYGFPMVFTIPVRWPGSYDIYGQEVLRPGSAQMRRTEAITVKKRGERLWKIPSAILR